MNSPATKTLAISCILLAGVLGLFLSKPNLCDRLHRSLFRIEPSEFSSFYHQTRGYLWIGASIVPENSVFFLGDSLTQSLPVNLVAKPAINYGIAGDTSAGLLNRIHDYHFERASAVVIAIGVNDLSRRPVEEIAANIELIVQSIPKDLTKICSAVLPLDQTTASQAGDANEKISRLNELLRKQASLEESIYFVDHPELRVGDSLRQDVHVGDGLHLNSKGTEIWANGLRLALEKAHLDN